MHFQKRLKNIVIIASEEAPVISETLQDIHGLSRKIRSKGIWLSCHVRILDNLEPKYFFELDITGLFSLLD
ncbi:MAG: hypothetical protein MZV63_16410 [Marinilabiliales bacterium]|nr:hypothetical protein [Marinilabiliales bacterium]